MNTKKTIVAFIYDYDHTLCTTDMQNYSFIPSLNIQPKEFWSKANDLTEEAQMDSLLAYMYLMIQESKRMNLPINREAFVQLGKDIQYFPGVESWFKRLDEYGKERGVEVQHYSDGVAVWPKSVVNYTTKTQFLYRINKGVLEISENAKVNASMPDEDKPVPFQNMVYIADGETDVPCMKTVRSNGGIAIAVYDKTKTKPASRLFNDGRVDFLCEADYSEGKQLDEIAKLIIDKVAPMDKLYRLHYKQVDEENKK